MRLELTVLLIATCVACGSGSTSREPISSTGQSQAVGGGASPAPAPAAGPDGTPQPAAASADELETVSWATPPFTIFRYEAAVVNGKAVSAAGQEPTVNIDFAGAKAACEAAGYRLCKDTEWFAACKGKDNLKYGYAADAKGPPPVEDACDVARTANNTPGSLPSKAGAFPSCVTKGTKIHDMIGNATEWTVNAKGAGVAAGVAFYQPPEQSHCDATLSNGQETMPESTKSTDVGFRCCK